MRSAGRERAVSRRILVVDDEPELAAAIQAAIEQDIPDAEVTTVGDPRAALEAARLSPPDLLVSDYRMPGMSGLQLLERLRADLPNLKSIMLTGDPSPGIARDAHKRGGTQFFFIKPFDLDSFTRAVDRLTRPAETQRA